MRKLLLFVFAPAIFLSGCKKNLDMEGNFLQPGVAITFDDNSVRNWHRNLNFLDSLGIHATFYISNYHSLSANEKRLLKVIESRGHEIAYHTTNHRNLEDLYFRKGWGYLYDTEIRPDMQMMMADSFAIKNFAYPFGKHCRDLDNNLLQLFNSVRALDGTRTNNGCFAVSANSRMLSSMGIDESSNPSMAVIEEKLKKAINDQKCLVLLGHEIENPRYRYQTRRETLRRIAEFVQAHHMKFYRVDEITRK